VRSYSIVKGDTNEIELGIALAEPSRGGSRYLHAEAKIGDVIEVGATTAAIPTAKAASNHIFVAGGIGITAFLTLLETYQQINYSYVLHYAVRSQDDVPFRERLGSLGDKVILYDKRRRQRMDIPGIVKGMPWNSHLYFCGPRRMMDEALHETTAAGVPENEVHFEAFEADTSGDPFEAVVVNRGRTLRVGHDETLLEVLQKHFDNVHSSCGVGNCGTCKIVLREGHVDHRGTALTNEEKADSMLSCVSRGVGRIVVEL
jgi:ferredoxin-NADP reductase